MSIFDRGLIWRKKTTKEPGGLPGSWIGTLVWPNEVDFCFDVPYSEATGQPLPEFEMT
ncbi:MAG: hypothetical protein Kow0063_37080 [Anaerolineae bacterium]